MLKFKNEEEAKGVRFPGGLKEVADIAAPIWNLLAPNERWIYEEEARKGKEESRFNLENKYTSQGKSYAEVEREKNEAIEQLNKMNYEIENTVRSLDYCSSLQTHPFYLIHVNYYCRQENGMYTPCEIALADCNFLVGVKRVYHTLINPGTIPLGYKYEANTHSQQTHQIPVPPEEFGGERDYVKILYNIKQFLGGTTRGVSSMPPLYTLPNSEDAVKNVLWKLQESESDNVNADDMFRVYSLPKLFYELRNACVPDKPGAIGFPVFALAERVLERDVFNFTKGISCEFHEETDAVPHCSLSCVRRWGFLIMDYCCKDLGIQLVPGQHCPRQADTSRAWKVASQSSSTAGDSHPHLYNPLKKTEFVDYGRHPPDPSSAQHYTLGATPGIVTVTKQPAPSKQPNQEHLEHLRHPRTDSLALSLMKDDDFPSLGSSKPSKPAGVMNEEERAAVARRGNLSTKLANPISIGRGREPATDLVNDFKNMQFD